MNWGGYISPQLREQWRYWIEIPTVRRGTVRHLILHAAHNSLIPQPRFIFKVCECDCMKVFISHIIFHSDLGKYNISVSHMLQGLLDNNIWSWFEVELWRVPHVGQEMLNPFRNTWSHPDGGSHSLLVMGSQCQFCLSLDYSIWMLILVCLLGWVWLCGLDLLL